MFAEEEIRKILNRALQHGGDYADLFVSENYGAAIHAEERKVESFYRGFDQGAGIRVIQGDFASYCYTNDLSCASLLRLAERAAESFDGVGTATAFVPTEHSVAMKDGAAYDLEKIGNLIRDIEGYTRSLSHKIRQVSIGYGDSQKKTLLASTAGKLIRKETARKRFFVRVVAENNGELQTALETLGDTEAVFGWQEEDLRAKAAAAADRAVKQLSAKDAPAGNMTVVLSSSAGGTMVHEACGHGLEGDSVSKGLSVYKDRLGQPVAAEKITVIDDATLKGRYGSYAFDDEGNAGRRNVLIENGILKQYMYDVRSALRMGTASTGNGRRESYRFAPQVRMSNTFIAPGKDDPESVIADVKKGLFVTKMGGGQVNTQNGDFVFEVSEGYLIENGKVTYPVKNASLIGNGPATLSKVFAVGNDLGFAIGTCGKGGQSVPVGDAQPTLGISDLRVGGKA